MDSCGYIIVDSCIISFNFNCVMELKQFYNIATKVSRRKKCYYFWWSTWLIKQGVYSVCMVVSWHGNVFRITGPLWEESIGHDGAIDKAESGCCISDDIYDDWGSHWYSKGPYSISQEICNCLPLVLLSLLTLCHSSHVIALVIFASVASHVLGELPDYLASS